jgi:predicted phage terminase large subunit-like protein
MARRRLPAHGVTPRKVAGSCRATGRRRPDRRAGASARGQEPRRPQSRLGQGALRRGEDSPGGRRVSPSRLADNPYLDRGEYEARLADLPLAERERLLHGDWEIPDDGELFQRAWFELIERQQVPAGMHAVRFWDLAGSEPSGANRDPDYTVGLLLGLDLASGEFYIVDIVRERKAPGAVERLVCATAARDGRTVAIGIEQEPGAAGVALVERYKRQLLRGYRVYAERVTGRKDVRAAPVAAAAENGLVKLVRGRHSEDFLDELTAFPCGAHDDCLDALSGAHNPLTGRGTGQLTVHVPRRRLPSPLSRLPLDRRHAGTPEELAAFLGATYYPGRSASG